MMVIIVLAPVNWDYVQNGRSIYLKETCDLKYLVFSFQILIVHHYIFSKRPFKYLVKNGMDR